MLNHDLNDDGNFSTRLLKAQAGNSGNPIVPAFPDLQQWLEYWNDADTVSGNLRKVNHWLQRAHQQQSA
jgi:uncharacterized protein Usg